MIIDSQHSHWPSGFDPNQLRIDIAHQTPVPLALIERDGMYVWESVGKTPGNEDNSCQK